MHFCSRARRYSPVLLLWFGLCLARAEAVRVATYNLEAYLDQPTESRPAKSPAAKAKIVESIRALNPDVLALEEMGSTNALLELQASLKAAGLDLPHWEHVSGYDTNIHVAVLSRFPFSARRSHSGDTFLLGGRRHRVSRGFVEVDVQVTPDYTFTLFVAHLKSKRAVAEADESELRLEEARLLREKIEARLSADPDARLLVAGDFNDTKDSASTRAIIGRGKFKLTDTRPAERNGDNTPSPNPAWEPRNVTWTHYFGKADTYSRIDFILASPAMAKSWVKSETYVLALPNWGVASDHRPVLATFETAQ